MSKVRTLHCESLGYYEYHPLTIHEQRILSIAVRDATYSTRDIRHCPLPMIVTLKMNSPLWVVFQPEPLFEPRKATADYSMSDDLDVSLGR